MVQRRTYVRHWLPIVTFCPVNHLPDLIYIEVEFLDDTTFENTVHELYAIRKQIRKIASWRKAYMEDIATHVFTAIRGCSAVTVTLAFGRHVVSVWEE
jgi:hypothetical protein